MKHEGTDRQSTGSKEALKPGRTVYVFRDRSELPKSKPQYVVMSPAPLGHRRVPDRANPPRPPSFRLTSWLRAVFKGIVVR